MTTLNHEHWMRQALHLARDAADQNEIPVGCLILHHPPAPVGGLQPEPKIIATGFNRREALHDPSAHAEIVAMRQAGLALNHWRLLDCTMYVTLEPCPMCAGALVQSRLPRLVYACRDPKAGAVHSLFQLCSDPRLNHRLEIIPDILADESSALLKEFFAARRKSANPLNNALER
ncbi:MAG: tRNA adenosine(34) deaminase TadA [Phycisphaerae bacterium]